MRVRSAGRWINPGESRGCGHDNQAAQDSEGQITDADHAGVVDEISIIFGPVILIVEACEETHERNSCLPETHMIRTAGTAGSSDGQTQVGLV